MAPPIDHAYLRYKHPESQGDVVELDQQHIDFNPTSEDEYFKGHITNFKKAHSVYHGLSSLQYFKLIEHGAWAPTISPEAPKPGELFPYPAVYFTTHKAWVMYFAMIQEAAGVATVDDICGIVVESILPAGTRVSVVAPYDEEYRREFSRRNMENGLLEGARNRAVTAGWREKFDVIALGLRQHWVAALDNSEVAEIHQLAVINFEPPNEAPPNQQPSRVHILNGKKLVVPDE